jgi:hypothetical protein
MKAGISGLYIAFLWLGINYVSSNSYPIASVPALSHYSQTQIKA